MTELAPVFGTEPGTVWVGIGSSDSRCFFTVARCVRLGRGVVLGLSSESESACADDFAFECCLCGTPLGRTSLGFSSGEIVVGSAATQRRASPTTQKNPARDQRFMGGKLAIKIQPAQAGVTNPCRTGLVQFRTLPAHR